MSFKCIEHGWTHLLESCPSCQLVTMNNNSGAWDNLENKHIGSSFDEHMLKEHENMAKEIKKLRAENSSLSLTVASLQDRIATLQYENEGMSHIYSELQAETTHWFKQCAEAREVIEWYANWDWSDKYLQAIPKKAYAFINKYNKKY